MYPHGAHPSKTPSLSRPRVVPMPASVPVPLHVTSSRKVHRSGDGIINIIQEIFFYAEGGIKSQAGKQLKEVHLDPPAQARGRFSAETNSRVFVGERLIRMLISTTIRPNSSDSLEIDEVFHFAENPEAAVVPVVFEATLDRSEGEHPAVEFDLQSPLVITLKQRILKDPGEQYKVLQAIELRANESDSRPTQELARKSTLSQPTNDTAQFRERIFAGNDVLRVDRDIIFVCDRPVLSLSERREYMPSYPVAPRRRSTSLTQSAPRVSLTSDKPRSRSQSRSWNSEDSENCRTAREDLPTATSPYSLREDESNSRIPPCNGTATARATTSPLAASPCTDSSSRNARSKRKKWTVNSVVSKPGAATPERYDRARVMRSLSTARNLSMSPIYDRVPDYNNNSQLNGEIPAVPAIPIEPKLALGPHGESQLVEGMEVLKVASPADSLIRTCLDGCSPRRSSTDCSTAGEIRTASTNNRACDSPPFSSPRHMPGSVQSSAAPSRHCTPLRTARNQSPRHQREPSSAGLNKRRVLFGYGTRPATSPMRSARLLSPVSPMSTCHEASPLRTAQKIVMSPIQTAVRVQKSSHNSQKSSTKSQKQSHKESKRSCRSDKRSAARPRLTAVGAQPEYRNSPSTTNLATARNLFGTVSTNESVEDMFSAARYKTPSQRTTRESPRTPRSPAVGTARAHSITVSPESNKPMKHGVARVEDIPPCCNLLLKKCGHKEPSPPLLPADAKPLRIETWADYKPANNKFGKHDLPESSLSPIRALPTDHGDLHWRRGSESPLMNTGRHFSPFPTDGLHTAAERSPARGLHTARHESPARGPMRAQPRMLFGDILTSPAGSVKTARAAPARDSPYDSNEKTDEDNPKTARALSHRDGTTTARSPAASIKTAKRQSPYEKNVQTARESRSPAPSLKTARHSPYDKSARSPALMTARRSPYEKTAREASHASPARGLPTARGQSQSPAHSVKTARQSPFDKSARSPALMTARQSPYGTSTAREARSPSLNTARQQPHYDSNVQTARESRSPAPSLRTARNSPYNKSARSPALNTAMLSPYEQNVLTARAASSNHRSPLQSIKTARNSPYEKTAREASHASPARGLPTARGPSQSPARSLKTATPHSPSGGGPRSVYLDPEIRQEEERENGTFTQTVTARAVSPAPRDGPRSLYLAPEMAPENGTFTQTVTARAVSPAPRGDDSYTRVVSYPRSPLVVTARAVSPAPRDFASPLRSSMTARDQTSARSPHVKTARDDLNSTQSCISGGVDTNARWTARSAPRSPMMATSRNASASPIRTARSGYAAPTTTPTRHLPEVMQHLPSIQELQQSQLRAVSPIQRTAIYGGGDSPMVTSRTQSPATRSSASNVATAQVARSPQVDTGSPTNVRTAREQRVPRSPAVSFRTGREHSRGPAASPANLRTARDHRSAHSKSPAAPSSRLRTAATRTPEHNTMHESHLRQEDSYSEQSQFTYQKTPSGYTQKPTHSAQLMTGQQRTPTKTDNNSLYYSARQTTPSRTLRPDDVTLTKRTPKRDFSQDAGLEARSPSIRTAVDNTPSKRKLPKVEEMPKCSLKSGCQVTHAPRILPAGPDSDRDSSPSIRTAIAPRTPERSLRTARGPSHQHSAPCADMRTPRTSRASAASPASSLLRSPAPSSHMMTAVSPDAASNSNNSNEDVATAQRGRSFPSAAASPRPTSAARGSDNWAAATAEPPAVAATTKPRVIVRANQSNGKIYVEVCLSFKLNTTGTIRVRGEMASALHPRSVSVNGQQIWSDSSRR